MVMKNAFVTYADPNAIQNQIFWCKQDIKIKIVNFYTIDSLANQYKVVDPWYVFHISFSSEPPCPQWLIIIMLFRTSFLSFLVEYVKTTALATCSNYSHVHTVVRKIDSLTGLFEIIKATAC